jgi:hypothetical protein
MSATRVESVGFTIARFHASHAHVFDNRGSSKYGRTRKYASQASLEGSRADKRRIVHPCVGADSGDLCAMTTESVAYPERTSHEQSAGPHSSRESQEVAPRAVGRHSGMRSIVVLGWVIMTEILVGAASSEVSPSSHSLNK